MDDWWGGKTPGASGTEILTTRWIAVLKYFDVHDVILIKFNHWHAELFSRNMHMPVLSFIHTDKWGSLRFTSVEDKNILISHK